MFNSCLIVKYIADLNIELKNRNIEGIAKDNIRIWNLAYADDIVLLAKSRVALRDMMNILRRFLRNRKLELCAENQR